MTGLVPHTASAHTLAAGTLVTAAAVLPVAGPPFVAVERTTSERTLPVRPVTITNSGSYLLSHPARTVLASREAPAVVSRRPHSVDLGGLARRPEAAAAGRPGHAWLTVVPCKRIRPRDCDELPDEFRRAGIGICFEGRNRYLSSNN